MNKADAIRTVASNLAAQLSGGTFEEVTGLMTHEVELLSNDDCNRLAWAVEEVGNRLAKMGGVAK